MNPSVLIAFLLLAADPFWQAKAPAQWTDLELREFLTDSPWAQMAKGPGNAVPILVFLATSGPMQQAEQERDRRARLKRTSKESSEEDLLLEEYHVWLEDNRTSQIVLAIRIPDTKAFSNEREVRQMEEESVMRIGRKKIKMTGHFPPSPSDPYLRIAFPRQVQLSDKTLSFDLYLPGVSIPYRTIEFTLKDMLARGKLEL